VTVLVGEVSSLIIAPFAAPIMVHFPVAVTGEAASAASVNSAALQSSWSPPALAATGGLMLVSTTSLNVEHDPLLIVQRSVALLPAAIPVTVVVGDAVLVIVAVPDCKVHSPVPGPAAFAAIVKVEVLHCSSAGPASATGGVALLVSTTSSLLVHDPFVIVHLNVTLLPAVSPVTPLVSEEAVVTEAPFAAPTMLQDPVPVTAAFAAKVKLPLLHCSWSAPASAVVGSARLVNTTSSKLEHEPFEMVHRSVTLEPAESPVTVVVGELILVITAPLAAPWIVHVPVPTPGLFPASVKIAELHCS
jgi:hypothetical protein